MSSTRPVNDEESGSISRRRFLQLAAAGTAGLALGAKSHAGQTAQKGVGVMNRPNVLLIMPDQHRGDCLSCSGHAVVRTPNIDRIASEGINFTRTYTQSPICVPARAALMVGRYPHQIGILHNKSFLRPETPNLLHCLQDTGYHTAEIGKVHLGAGRRIADTRDNIDHLKAFGFDYADEDWGKMAYVSMTSPWTDSLKREGLLKAYQDDMKARAGRAVAALPITEKELEGIVPKQMWYADPSPAVMPHYPDNSIGDRSVAWLKNYSGDRPFFLQVGFMGPHDPYDAPQEYADPYLKAINRIPLDSLKLPETPSDDYRRMLDIFTYYSDSDSLDEEKIRRLRAYYYGNISLIDEKIGEMLAVLEERGWMDNTLIIYTSDHGDHVGHHKLVGKVAMYNPSMHVPLVIRPPKAVEPRTVEDLIELNDVNPTILEAAGAAPLAGSHAASLFPYLGRTDRRIHDAVFSEVYAFTAVITDRYNYVVERATGRPCSLYDLDEDPLEENNLAADPAAGGIRDRLYERHLKPFLAGQ